MTPVPSPASLTACLLLVAGCFAQKVYFDCGAKVDVVDVQGLILSPGFPYNYSSGTHCVWQFVVPVDYQLVLEIFDFDVFESHDSEAQYSAFSNFEEEDEEAAAEERGKVTPTGLSADGSLSAAAKPAFQSAGDLLKTPRDGVPNQVVVQEQSTKIEIAKVTNSAKRSADLSSIQSSLAPSSLLLLPGAAPPADEINSSVSASPSNENLSPTLSPSAVVEDTTYGSPPSTGTPPVSPETQQSILDACPHDVLYISDLITFSSRFCGSNRPPSSQLVFGSSQEMVEVIMELITTTHWGRGFALLFHYHNLTEPGEDQRATSPSGGKVDSLLAAVSGAAFFALILTTVLCIIFRPKLCPKRASSCTSTNSEVAEGAQSVAAEISELQLMAENQAGPESTAEQDTHSNQPRSDAAEGDVPQTADVELYCSGLTELDLGADEVFIASPAACPSRLLFYPHARERFLRHSDTGPGPSRDWPSADTSPAGARSLKESVCSRPRAWSVRTFQDFLPPLPQLHKKWCSWNSTSPFTKLVDNTPSGLIPDCRESNSRKVFSNAHLEAQVNTSIVSDSSASNASYPLTQPAQRQRRLNSTSNLRRSRFTGPCFGLLSETKDPPKGGGVPPGCIPSETGPGSSSPPSSSSSSSSSSAQCHVESGPAGKRLEFPGEGHHISVPVFAISEEEDRQPLVSAQHLEQTNGPVGAKLESKRPPAGSVSPKRLRPEWRPWGSQVSGGAAPPASGAFRESGALKNGQPSVSLSTGLCSVTNHM
ncbi:uncharacterized protein si:dkey-112e17.1 isoform X2 [Poeciliopsis prolifica]|uniref:uncharacterized protein si:dkey-112e17.1 isoform X2 n=1 Tax=Poeciliopsis prolifica TaxID=188132 RepID=UPI002413BDDF|nr:uncharacterized protein si:dkey-112e17.1 isoform X2 [Poeciliopsis prolifica]